MPVKRIPRDPELPRTQKAKRKRGVPKGTPKPAKSGRKAGTRNKYTMDIKEASLLAACMHGSDGKGKDALVGYMFKLCKQYPETYTREILGKILPAHLVASVASTNTLVQAPPVRLTREELVAQLQARGVNITSINLDRSQYASDRNQERNQDRNLLPPVPKPNPDSRSPASRNGNGSPNGSNGNGSRDDS